MLIPFSIVVIIYGLIGFNVIKLKDHKGKKSWGLIIFISTLAGVLFAFASLNLRFSDRVSNAGLIAGIIVSLVYVFKYYLLNRDKLHWAHILHVIYAWIGISMASTLILELIPYIGSNYHKSVWGSYIGIGTAGLLIVNLVISVNNSKNKNI